MITASRPHVFLLVGWIGTLGIAASGCAPQEAERPAQGAAAATAAQSTGAPRAYACDDLLTPREIDDLTGRPGATNTTAPRTADDDELYQGVTSCEWSLPQGMTLALIVYDTRAFGGGGPFDDAWEQARSQGGEQVTGLGDEALLRRTTIAGTVLTTRAPSRGIIMRIGDPNEAGGLDKPEVLRRATALVIGRL